MPKNAGRVHAEEPEDAELARRFREGETGAFSVLVSRHQPRLLAICRSITHDEHDAHDALQNTLIAAWRGLGSFQGRATVGTWLSRIAINASLDEVRRRGRRPAPTEQAVLTPVAVSGDDMLANRVALAWAMEQLPPHVREIVLLRDHYGLSYLEIAERRGSTPDAVRAHLARGRRSLAELLDSTQSRARSRAGRVRR
ncbi:RNA polymerase sigma factor [Streptomyces sp. NPDC006992]|uniref:RNA polymerase sigma factor n=1 Tax=unclassified Streptomyces TaxID=2593676 RepID=UPI003407A30D